MKKTVVSIVLMLFSTLLLFGQKSLDFKGQKIKDSRIYFVLSDSNMEFFTHDQTEDGKVKIKNSQLFSLQGGNSCNIYLKWLNPIKYRITWKDSTYRDERDVVIEDFINLLTAQFGVNRSYLTGMQLMCKNEEEEENENDTKNINNDYTNLSTLLNQLDSLNPITIPMEIDEIFKKLYNIQNPTEVLNTIVSCEQEILKISSRLIEINSKTVEIQNLVKEIYPDKDINLLHTINRIEINFWLDAITMNLEKNKLLIKKLIPLMDMLKNSIKEESVDSLTKGFFRVKSISFDDGKKFETVLTITKYNYNSDTKEFSKDKVVNTTKLIFQKYDYFVISVSTGIFYSSSTLNYYGVSTASNGTLTISEDNITKSSPVTAVFLNFNFGIGSRYFAPLAQIGIDPSKKRPFLLVGLGFSIPSAKIAFSAGPLWTWAPTLNKLSLGETITSTTVLEKDIIYKFDLKPKGWYLGIQYNF